MLRVGFAGYMIQSLGFRVGLRHRVYGTGYRVQGIEHMVQVRGYRV
jgi:hypothetical protein